MAKTRALAERAAERRRRILEAAARLFREKGYDAVKVDDIASSLGVSKVSIYYYIESKEQILYQIHHAAATALVKSLEGIVSSDEPPDVKLRRAIVNHIVIVCSETSPTGTALKQTQVFSRKNKQRIIKKRDQYDQMLRQLIQEGIDQGVFVDCDPKPLSLLILGAANYVPYWYSPEGPLDKVQIAEIFSDHIMRMVLQSRGDSG